MDEEQILFEQLTLNKMRISRMWCFCIFLIFELIQQAALVNFMMFLNIFKILKMSF